MSLSFLDSNDFLAQSLQDASFGEDTFEIPQPNFFETDNKASTIASTILQSVDPAQSIKNAKILSRRASRAAKTRALKNIKGPDRGKRLKEQSGLQSVEIKPEQQKRSMAAEKAKFVESLTKLRKSDLDEREISRSPIKNLIKVSYANDIFAKTAAAYKKKKDITAGRNVAVALYSSPDSKHLKMKIAATDGPPGQPHAEAKLFDSLPEKVREDTSLLHVIYTERKPCQHTGQNCERKLKAVLGEETKVLYSIHHSPDKDRQLMNELEFQARQAEEENIRLGANYRSLLRRAEGAAKKLNLDVSDLSTFKDVYDEQKKKVLGEQRNQ